MLAAASTGASFVITEAMLEPIVTSITSNSTVLIPVGLTIMGIMVGIGLIPRIIYKYLQVPVMAVRDFRLSEVPLLLHWSMEVFMTRLALVVLLSAIFCFPCYASSALPASPSNALIKGYDIPDLPKSDNYSDYAIIKNTVSYSMNKDYADYLLFAFYSPPVVTYGGYGFQDDTLHFTGHLGWNYDAFLYSLSLGKWVKLGGEYGLLNNYDLERDKLIMSTTTIVYKDRLKVFYYYFPVTSTFEQQPMFSDLIQLIYRVVISLIVVIVLIISIRIILKIIYRVVFFYLRKGIL